jgi:AraC-like DNA-binding protein
MTLSNQIFILISIIGAVQSIFLLIYIIFIKKIFDHSSIVLCLLLGVYALRMTKWIAYFLPEPFFNIYNNLTFGLQTTIGPLFYIYIYLIIDKETQIRKIDWLHLIPFILVLLLSNTLNENSWHTGSTLLAVISFHWVLHLLFGLAYIYNYWQSFRDLNRNKQTWVMTFIVCNLLMGFSFFIYAYLDSTDANVFSVTFTISSLLLSFVYLKYMTGSIKNSKKAKTSLDENFVCNYKNKLDALILQKIYTDPNLTIPKLAEILSIQPYLLSQIINENYNQNFSDFINFHRIEEAKDILSSESGKDQKIASIAYECGFNTLSAFNTAFKKFTKTTPSQFRT